MRGLTLCLIVLAAPLAAEEGVLLFGGDAYLAGARVERELGAGRDVTAAARSLALTGTVAGDLHAAGLSVLLDAATEGDVYAAGANVVLSARAAGDVSVVGASVALTGGGGVGGNLRALGATLSLAAPVEGSAMLSGGDVRLDAPISGDLRVQASALSFGPGARVGGRLIHLGPERVEVPASVAPPERVSHLASGGRGWRDLEGAQWDGLPKAPSRIALGAGFLMVLGFLLALGAILLALIPGQVRRMRLLAHERPALTVLWGFLAFSAIVGLVPVSLMTLIGIPLMPFAVLLAILAWTMGYLLGAYVVAMAAARALGMPGAPPIWARLAVLAVGITLATLLNFVPFLGWMANLALVFLGLGATVSAILRGGGGTDGTEAVP